jgi:type IV secretory pathway protease TraF
VFTASVPKGWYASKTYDRTPLARGQGVCFRVTPTGWIAERGYFRPGESVCKLVLGVPGDEIRPQGDELTVCHAGSCRSVGKVLPADSRGRASVSAFPAPVVIPEGKYYLGSTHHPRSFDSRYLGLVDASAISVRTWPLWTD